MKSDSFVLCSDPSWKESTRLILVKGKHFLKNSYGKNSHVAVADTPKEIIQSCLYSFALIFTEVIYTDFYYFSS